MGSPLVSPYGTWRSPVTSELIVSRAVGIGQVALEGDRIYWLESRPLEGGRGVVVARGPDGTTTDVTPPPYNVRTRVHEYGGGAYAVDRGEVYFVNFADQRLYRQAPGGAPTALTPEGAMRYADLVVDRRRNRLLCVREDHGDPERGVVNSLVAVSLAGDSAGQVLASGHDFYSSPRLSPEGNRVAWLAWNHPNMPWDGCELWVGELGEDGTFEQWLLVAGGPGESIFQPEWSADGGLYFVSDRSGWWNLYRWRNEQVERVTDAEAEFGTPQWVFGMSTYDFAGDGQVFCTFAQGGFDHLATLDPAAGALRVLSTPFTEIAPNVRAREGHAVFTAGSPAEPAALVRLDLRSGAVEVLRRTADLAIEPGYISVAEHIAFPTENGLTAYGYFYAPRNRDFVAPPDEKPPLIVKSHGGPTSSASSALRLDIQYWTSRGFAVLDVNYGGSTGYGRAYRERLNGQWGVVDVDDCVNGARYLVEKGLVDGARLAITGGSAGGFTTLAALAFRDVFRAGASHYGVSDLEALVRDTHKFESRYLDRLVGPYPARKDLYDARSPLNHADRIRVPVIFFQGLEDAVVPPSQTEMMVEALRRRRVPVAYLSFPGEQHGFRRAENIKRALDAELYFYGRVFRFQPADEIEPVPIDNLSD